MSREKYFFFLFHHWSAFSQNHWGWKGPFEGILSNPLLKQGHLQPGAEDHVQLDLSISTDGCFTTPLGNLYQFLTILTVTKVVFCVQTEFPIFSVVPTASWPVSRHYWERSCSLIFIPSHQVLTEMQKIPCEPSLLQEEHSQLSQPLLRGEMLRFLHCLHGPSLDLLRYVHVSLVLGSPELETGLQVQPHQCKERGRITSLNPLTSLCLMQPRIPLAFSATKTFCRLMVSLLSTRLPRFFSAELPSTKLVRSVYRRTSLHRQDFAFPLAELNEIPLSPFLQPAEVPLKGTVWCITHSSQFCIACELAKCTLCPVVQTIH